MTLMKIQNGSSLIAIGFDFKRNIFRAVIDGGDADNYVYDHYGVDSSVFYKILATPIDAISYDMYIDNVYRKYTYHIHSNVHTSAIWGKH